MSLLLHPQVVARRVHLRRGINLSHWFSQVYVPLGYSPLHFDHYMTGEDLALIRSMGFDHVRFPIAPEPLLREARAGRLPPGYLERLDRVVEAILDQGLRIILDLHPEQAFKKQLAREDEAVETFLLFWEKFAAHFSKFDPSRTFFEVLNEPEIHDPKRWNHIQHRAVAAIRGAAPHHTIIIGGDEWSQFAMLPLIEPPADRNILVNFHLYDPIAFTHQGAKWVHPWNLLCKGMTYPSDPAFIGEFLKDVTDADAIREITAYGTGGWNAVRYEKLATDAAAWGRLHGVALTCNEFGVYKVYAPRESRLAWVRDVRRALEQAQIGWTMWDYAGDFKIVHRKDGVRTPDAGLLSALGLTSAKD